MSGWYAEFLQRTREAGCAPDVVSYHQYLLGAGVDPQVGRKALEPAWLDRQKAHATYNLDPYALSLSLSLSPKP